LRKKVCPKKEVLLFKRHRVVMGVDGPHKRGGFPLSQEEKWDTKGPPLGAKIVISPGFFRKKGLKGGAPI